MVTDGKEDAFADNGWQELLNEESQEYSADGGEIEVVDQEQGLELERLAVAHELSAGENDEVIDDNEDGRRLERGHRRLEWHEFEVISLLANNCLEGLVEDGP